MLPVVITELVAEGMYYVRMALAAKKMFDRADVTVRLLDSMLNAGTLRHEIVVGEHVYYYVLCKELIVPLAGQLKTVEDRTDLAILSAVGDFIRTRSSADVLAIATELPELLGYHLQREMFPVVDVVKLVEAYLSHESKDYTLHDPLFSALTSSEATRTGKPSPHILTLLGMTEAHWDLIISALTSQATGSIRYEWTKSSDDPRLIESSRHRKSVTLGLVLAGARRYVDPDYGTVIGLGGRDGFEFEPTGLIFATSPRSTRPPVLPNDASITAPMANSVAVKNTLAAGYVWVPGESRYVHFSEVEVRDIDGTPTAFVQRGVFEDARAEDRAFTFNTATGENFEAALADAISMVTGALKSQATSFAQTEGGKIVASLSKKTKEVKEVK